MKDQYFGDFGDYQKVSLLRQLAAAELKVLVYWMKTENDASTDGKHITYLDKPETWRSFDPEIYDFLQSKIRTEPRSLQHIEQSAYCAGIEFLNESIETTVTRENSLRHLVASDSDIVLFDPDNGIEVASTTGRTIHKYVTWAELASAFTSGKSLIVYQHFSRTARESFIEDKAREIKKRIGCSLVSVQVRHSVYFFLIQERHEKAVQSAITAFAQTWKQLAEIRKH